MAVTQGLVGFRFPYIPLRIVFTTAHQSLDLVIEALVNTGFDGDVIVPSSLIDELAATEEPDSFVIWRLADGSEVVARAYVGTAELPGIPGSHAVLISVLGDEPIAGRGLTDRFRLILDHGERIALEP